MCKVKTLSYIIKRRDQLLENIRSGEQHKFHSPLITQNKHSKHKVIPHVL